jgi:hypothetical protein
MPEAPELTEALVARIGGALYFLKLSGAYWRAQRRLLEASITMQTNFREFPLCEVRARLALAPGYGLANHFKVAL